MEWIAKTWFFMTMNPKLCKSLEFLNLPLMVVTCLISKAHKVLPRTVLTGS